MSLIPTIETQVNTYGNKSQLLSKSISLDNIGWVSVWISDGQDGSETGIYLQAFALDGSKIGAEVLVNSTTMGPQSQPDITMVAANQWVVTWTSYDNNGTGANIYQQSFELDAIMQNVMPKGMEFKVNTTVVSEQQNPQIAALPGGGWVVVWQSLDQDGSGEGIIQQVFKADGTKAAGEEMTDETIVNQFELGNQQNPQITVLSNGKWVVTWESEGEDGSENGVYQQLFDANGTRNGAQTLVNTTTVGYQDLSSTIAVANGEWIVLFTSRFDFVAEPTVKFQRYGSDGIKIGNETTMALPINDYPGNNVPTPDITLLDNGNWLVSWIAGLGTSSNVYHQLFDPAGSKIGTEFHVDISGQTQQREMQVTALNGGGWVTTWYYNSYQTNTSHDIFQQAFNSDGTSHGGRILVNDHTEDVQVSPQVLALSDGGWVTSWNSIGQDFTGYGVFQKLFHFGMNTAPVGTGNSLSILEDQDRKLTVADFGFTDVNGDGLGSVKITAINGGTINGPNGVLAVDATISAAQLTNSYWYFRPDSNLNGNAAASISYVVIDNGGVANGGSDTAAAAATLIFDIAAVSDAPTSANASVSIAKGASYQFSANDFAFSDVDTDNFVSVRIVGFNGKGILSFDGLPIDTSAYIPITDLNKLVFQSTAGESGNNYASLTFTVRDDGDKSNGGQNTGHYNYFTVNVSDGVNIAPAGTDNTISVPEDGIHQFGMADFGYSDTDGNAFASVIITAKSGAGVFTFDGNAVSLPLTIAVANLGKLIFTPDDNQSGNNYATLSFKVMDDGGTANGGVDTDQSANVLTFKVDPVNDAPEGADKAINLVKNSDHAFTAADFGYSDSDGNAFASVTITATTGMGSFKYDGNAVSLPITVNVADLGKLVFTPVADAVGDGYATMSFQVTDDGGMANGGIDTDQSANVLTFNVGGVNIAPAGTDKTITFDEEGSHAFTADDFGFSDANDNAFASITVSAMEGRGSLTLNGVAVSNGDVIMASELDKLVFASGEHENGINYGSFQFQVTDDGGTADGGVDTDQSANTISFSVNEVVDRRIGDNGKNKLIGTEGDDFFRGKHGNDTMIGKAGSDTFLFRTGDDRDVIRDFDAVGDDHDILNLHALRSVKNFNDLMKHHISEHRGDVIIDGLNGDRITLKNVDIDDLGKSDFIF